MTARRALGHLIGLVARVWIATLRVTIIEHPALATASKQPWILTLWHGHQLGLLAHRRRRTTAALVSLSADGELLAAAFPRFALAVCRGSSSRGGARGLAHVIRRIRSGEDAAFAVDGPRGPRGVVAARGDRVGAAIAAERTGGVVVPYAAACARSVKLKTWDAFELPLPFSRVAIVLGAPLAPNEASPDAIARAINAAVDIGASALTSRLASPKRRARVSA